MTTDRSHRPCLVVGDNYLCRRYLAPTGAGDYVYAAALALRNLLAIHYVLGLSLLICSALAIVVDCAR